MAKRRVVDVAVSRIRDALWQASGGAGVSGEGPGAIAGRIFHETMAGLLRGPKSWAHVVTDETLGDHDQLRRHAYDALVGPLLTRNEAALGESGREALWLWRAVGEACQWLSTVLSAAAERGWISYDRSAERWNGADRLLASEEPLEHEFYRPGWTAAVRIHGYADALLRDPHNGRWCVIEFKLGDRNGAVDLCQAALYQALAGVEQPGDLALVRFAPERREQVLTADGLAPARESLIDLAGRLAGVAPGAVRMAPPPPPVPARYGELGQRIVKVLANFNIAATVSGTPAVGPAFVRYTLRPGAAVGVRRILNSAEDIGVQLGIPTPVIELEDGVLAVDIARGEDRDAVPFSRVREQLPARDAAVGSSLIPLGVDLNNELRMVDLAASESPHVLVAGTAGSGKTEWLRTAVASLILTNTPATLRLVLVDPKRTAFGDLASSPYLLGSGALLFPPEGSLSEQLDKLIEEMESRYRKFQDAGADDLPGWRARGGGELPRIVCVIDEFADMMADPRDRRMLEDRVVRLGAKSRAAGIHLILATQHPDARTVTGRLQANLSVRVCLRTTTWQQSMVALKQRGAERLLGKGDLFFSCGDRLARLQAPFLDEAERLEIYRGR